MEQFSILHNLQEWNSHWLITYHDQHNGNIILYVQNIGGHSIFTQQRVIM